MRRSRLALALSLAVALTWAGASAVAIGPGGWDRVGHGSTTGSPSLNGKVSALNTQRAGRIYAGGTFTNAGGLAAADLIAMWNGTTWSAVGSTPLSSAEGAEVRAIAYDAATGNVYAGGTFQNGGGNSEADFLAVWDGASWQPVCNSETRPAFVGNVDALQIIGNTIYVGGEFQDGAELPTADYLLACDLTTGTSSSLFVTDGQFSGPVYALAALGSTLYAGGNFQNLAQVPAADYVAAYTAGGGWQAMGAGIGPGGGAVAGMVRSLTVADPNVYVGTDALDVAGIAQADHVARWDASSLGWSAVGANTAATDGWFPTTTYIYAMGAAGSLVFAGGSFQDANGTATADMIAYFDGTAWRPIGSDGAGNGPLPAEVHGLEVFEGKLYAGGNFTSAGGDALAMNLAAYALRQPDAGISPTSKAGTHRGHVDGPFLGLGKYNATGSGQTRTVTVTRGHTIRCYLKIQNDGLVPASFKIKGTGGANGITPLYVREEGPVDHNITHDVRDGSYATVSIAARSSVVIRLDVQVAHSSASNATFLTTVRSAAGTPPDAVRLVVKATD